MPRTKLQNRVNEMKNPAWKTEFSATVSYGMVKTNTSADALAEKLGISRATWFNYKKNPEKIPLGVMRKIVSVLALDSEQVFKIVR